MISEVSISGVQRFAPEAGIGKGNPPGPGLRQVHWIIISYALFCYVRRFTICSEPMVLVVISFPTEASLLCSVRAAVPMRVPKQALQPSHRKPLDDPWPMAHGPCKLESQGSNEIN